MMEDFLKSLSPEQKQKMIQMLMDDTPEESSDDSEVSSDPPENTVVARVNDDFTVSRKEQQNGRQAVRARKNRWVDDGTEHMDIETPEFKRTARNRSKPKKTRVECHVCGKTFSINPALAFGEYHRCNKCTG
tara:strand:- start:289 stop:684 length:396 start_codon:yes stop_codon:yes gene_type:complete